VKASGFYTRPGDIRLEEITEPAGFRGRSEIQGAASPPAARMSGISIGHPNDRLGDGA
jgi:hypothetical protein